MKIKKSKAISQIKKYTPKPVHIYAAFCIIALISAIIFQKHIFSETVFDSMSAYKTKKELESVLLKHNENIKLYDSNITEIEELSSKTHFHTTDALEPEALLYLFEETRNNGFNDYEYRIMPRTPHEDGFQLRPVYIRASGSSESVFRYIELLENGRYHFAVQELEIDLSNANSPRLSILCSLRVTYPLPS